MGVTKQNSTNYVHSNEPNLTRIENAMQYNDAGEPEIRAHIHGITLEGNVLVDKVRVEVNANHDTITPNTPVSVSRNDSPNTSNNPIYASITNFSSFPTSITANQGSAGSSAWPVDIGSNGIVTLGSGTAYVGRVRLTDGTNNLSFELPNNDAEAGQYSIPVENYNYVYNGTSWDRMRGTINDGVLVKVSNPVTSVTATVTGTVALTQGTLDALENINAAVTGTVSLSQGTLDALETITVNQGTAGSSAWKVDIGTNGTVGITGSVEIKNDIDNPIPISKNLLVNSSTNPIFVQGTSDTSFFAPTQTDAFGRLRVSNPFTLGDFFNRYQDNASSFNYTTGGGSAGYDSGNASVTMNVGTANGDGVYRETSKVFAYQPGKSLLVLQTFTFAAAKNNLTQRAGYFDAADGFYLEQVGTSTINFVKRSSASGVLVETRISRTGGVYGAGDTGWNVNQLPSLVLTNSQILWMDIEWLGVGSARMGFVINGEFVHCHTFHHANQAAGVYMTTACLPVRKEIFNTGTTTGASSMLSICTSVISEGGYTFTGREFCIGHTLGTPVALPNDLSFKPIISIRLKSNRLGAIVIPTTYNVTPVQQAVYKYQIYKRAVTTGGSWISAGTTSSVEYNINPTSISSGEVVLSAFINSTNQSSGVNSVMEIGFEAQLERNTFTSTCYEYVIAVASSTNNTSCYGAINWKEIT